MFEPHNVEIVIKLQVCLADGQKNDYHVRVEPATAPSGNSPMRIDARGPTMATLRDEWILNLANGDRSLTYRRDALRTLNNFLQSGCFVFPAQVTDTSITHWLAQRKLLVAAPTLKNERGHLSAFCSFLVAKGIIENSPLDAVATPRILHRRARLVPTEDQVVRLIIESNSDWRKKHRWLLYLLAASIGSRRGALLGMEWHMVAETEYPPRIEFPPQLVKNRREQLVWLTEECATWLAVARKETGGKGLVFPMKQESEQFERDREAAGLPKSLVPGGPTFSFHSLRHFAATRMKAAEAFGDDERQSQMGHRTQRMTTNTYTDARSTMLGEKIFRLKPIMPQGFMPRWFFPKGKLLDSSGEDADSSSATFLETNALTNTHISRSDEPARQNGSRFSALGQRAVHQHARCDSAQVDRLTLENWGDRFKSCHPDSDTRAPLLVQLVRVQFQLIDLLLRESGDGTESTGSERQGSGHSG